MYAKEEFRGKTRFRRTRNLHWNIFRNEDGYIAYFQWYYEAKNILRNDEEHTIIR